MLVKRYSHEQDALRRAVRQFRVARGITQQQLSDLLHTPQSFVSKYESGERTLSFVDIVLICDALEIEVMDLYENYIKELNEAKY